MRGYKKQEKERKRNERMTNYLNKIPPNLLALATPYKAPITKAKSVPPTKIRKIDHNCNLDSTIDAFQPESFSSPSILNRSESPESHVFIQKRLNFNKNVAVAQSIENQSDAEVDQTEDEQDDDCFDKSAGDLNSTTATAIFNKTVEIHAEFKVPQPVKTFSGRVSKPTKSAISIVSTAGYFKNGRPKKTTGTQASTSTAATLSNCCIKNCKASVSE
jgi:hypothetical protein